MRKLVIGCTVAGLIALSPKSEARLPSAIARLPIVIPHAKENPEFGIASWYGEECQGNATASGELFDLQALTAAHRELPLGTRIKVTNLRNKKSILLRVNDRGPTIIGRLVDVSRAAAKRLGFLHSGLAPVRVEVVTYPKSYLRPQIADIN
jgi:rare lipoprotein A